MAFDPAQLPADLPAPRDDGAASHLTGLAMPPVALLSNAGLTLTGALRLPTFGVEVGPAYEGGGRRTMLKRLTLVIRDGVVEKVFYPVFPPDAHAEEVLAWAGAAAR